MILRIIVLLQEIIFNLCNIRLNIFIVSILNSTNSEVLNITRYILGLYILVEITLTIRNFFIRFRNKIILIFILFLYNRDFK